MDLKKSRGIYEIDWLIENNIHIWGKEHYYCARNIAFQQFNGIKYFFLKYLFILRTQDLGFMPRIDRLRCLVYVSWLYSYNPLILVILDPNLLQSQDHSYDCI